jgi:hypothetical protein
MYLLEFCSGFQHQFALICTNSTLIWGLAIRCLQFVIVFAWLNVGCQLNLTFVVTFSKLSLWHFASNSQAKTDKKLQFTSTKIQPFRSASLVPAFCAALLVIFVVECVFCWRLVGLRRFFFKSSSTVWSLKFIY